MRSSTSLPVVDVVGDVEDFHRKFAVAYDGKPRVIDAALAKFRLKFLKEELEEYEKALDAGSYWARIAEGLPGVEPGPMQKKASEEELPVHLAEMLDALVDLVYVAVGTAHLHGFDFDEAWRRVQEKNMQKVRAASAEDSKRGHASDVVKPPGWTPPSHIDLVTDHAHRGRR